MATQISYPTAIWQDSKNGVINSPFAKWNNLNNARYDDGNFATSVITKSTGNNPKPNAVYFSNFNFNIPENSIITGLDLRLYIRLSPQDQPIEVSIDRYDYVFGGVKWYTEGEFTNIKKTYSTNTQRANYTYYDETNRMVKALTPKILNDNWSVKISFGKNLSSNNGTIYLDALKTVVTFIEPANVNLTSGDIEKAEDNIDNMFDTNNVPLNEIAGTYMVSNGETTQSFPTASNPKIVAINEEFDYNVYFRAVNGISDQTQEVILNIPDNMEIVKVTTTGAYDYEKNIWYPRPVLKNVTTLTLTCKFKTIGLRSLSATLPNVRTTLPYYVYVNPFKPYGNEKSVEMCTTDIEYAKPDLSFIVGFHFTSTESLLKQYKFQVFDKNNVELADKDYPFDLTKVYLHPESEKNIYSCYHEDTDPAKVFNIKAKLPNLDTYALINFDFSAKSNENEKVYVKITDLSNDEVYVQEVNILKNKPMVLPAIGTQYLWKNYTTVIVTGAGKNITLWGKANHSFEYLPSDLSMTFEKPFGYIGCVKMTRSHMKPKNDLTETLLDEVYMNRENFGKKGDVKDTTTMQIRIPPKDVVTLRGLARIDKPIPIDLIPNWWSGDPLNHRGWAELYEVKNVEKINDMLYQCEPTVRYLTHSINTKFRVNRKDTVCGLKIPYELQTTFDKHSKLSDYMNVYNIPDKLNGYYTFDVDYTDDSDLPTYRNHLVMNTDERIILQSQKPLANNTNIKFNWLNRLSSSNNIEHSNWTMFLRLKDANDMLGTPLFEYQYVGFKHLDDSNNIINKCNAIVNVMDSNKMHTLNFRDLYLDYDDTQSAVTDDKINTEIQVKDCSIRYDNQYLIGTLVDKTGNPLDSKQVSIILKRMSDLATKEYPVLTTPDGIAKLKIDLSAGNYEATFKFAGDGIYNACEKNISFDCNIISPKKNVTLALKRPNVICYMNEEFVLTIKDYDGNPLKDMNLTIKATNTMTDKVYIVTKQSDVNGEAVFKTYLPNGTYKLQYVFEGTDNYKSYYSLLVDQKVNLTNDYKTGYSRLKFVSRNTLEFRQQGNTYEVQLTTQDGKPVINTWVNFYIFTPSEVCQTSYVGYDVLTNSSGVAKLPINLNNGVYEIHSQYTPNSTEKYLPEYMSEIINVQLSNTINTVIKAGSYKITSAFDDQKISARLITANSNKPIANKKLMFRLYRADSNFNKTNPNVYKDYFDTTDSNGYAHLKIGLNNGTYAFEVYFDGDKEYTKSKLLNANLTVSRDSKPTPTLTLPSVDTISTEPYDYVVSLKDTDNTPMIQKNITLTLSRTKNADGVVLNPPLSETRTLTTNNNGEATLSINYAKGTYTVVGNYGGDDSHSPVTTSTKTFVVSIDSRLSSSLTTNNCTITQSNFNYIIKLTDENSNPIVNELINFGRKDNNVSTSQQLEFTSAYTNVNGEVSINLGASNGDYQIYANYYGNEKYKPSASISHVIVNVDNTDITDGKAQGNVVITPSPRTTGRAMTIQTFQDNIVYHNPNSEHMLVKVIYNDTKKPVEGAVLKWCIYETSTDAYVDLGTVTTNNYGIAFIPLTTLQTDNHNYYCIVNMGDTYDTDSTDIACTKKILFIVDKNWSHTSTNNAFGGDLDNMDTSEISELKKSINATITIDNTSTSLTESSKITGTLKQGTTPLDGYQLMYKVKLEDLICDSGAITTETDGTFSVDLSKLATSDGYTFEIYLVAYQGVSATYTFNMANSSDYSKDSEIVPANDGSTFTNINSNVNTTDNQDKAKTNKYSQDTEYGSQIVMNIDYNKLSFVDYGLMANNKLSGGKVVLNNLSLPEKSYIFEVEVRFNRPDGVFSTPRLVEDIGLEINENIDADSYNADYRNLIISPSTVPDRIAYFSRKTEEGLLWFYKFDNQPIDYVGNPYNQYKGGCNLETYDGIDLIDDEDSNNPICISNKLVKVAFHRLLGFVELFRYDYKHKQYFKVRTLYIGGDTQFKLQSYDDDKIITKFGNTVWTMWRGHPFVQVEHPNDKIDFYNQIDSVWCELIDANGNLGVPYESNVVNGVFNTSYCQNLFFKKYQMNEPLTTKNFNLYHGGVEQTGFPTSIQTITNPDRFGANELRLIKSNTANARLRFPDPELIDKPSNAFTLFIDYAFMNIPVPFTVQLNCYGDGGRKASSGDYETDTNRIYTETRTITPTANKDDGTCEFKIRESFSLPTTWADLTKYIDFQINIPTTSNPVNLFLSNMMLYEGISTDVEFIVDDPEGFIDKTKVYFHKNFYCKMYNQADKYGLCVIKPKMETISLASIPPSDYTVFAPYMKNTVVPDRPEKVALEYMNFNDQEIIITGR